MADDLHPSHLLVTGATGFIGSRLTTRLLSLGAHVRAQARRPDRAIPLANAGAEVITADLTKPATLRGICDGCDVVVHSAAWLGTPYTSAAAQHTNVDGTAALAEEALAAGVSRFVHLSSIAVYGPARTGVITEESPLWGGVELYGDSKIASEAAVRKAGTRGLPIVIARPGIVYGPRSRGWTIRFVTWIQRGRPTMVAGGYGLSRPIYIENLVDALLLCTHRPVEGHAFTLVDEDLPWRAFLGYYARMVNRPLRSIPYSVAWILALFDETRALVLARPPRVRRTALGYAVSAARFNTDKARTLLGWAPRRTISDAMAMTEQWLIDNGYVRPSGSRST